MPLIDLKNPQWFDIIIKVIDNIIYQIITGVKPNWLSARILTLWRSLLLRIFSNISDSYDSTDIGLKWLTLHLGPVLYIERMRTFLKMFRNTAVFKHTLKIWVINIKKILQATLEIWNFCIISRLYSLWFTICKSENVCRLRKGQQFIYVTGFLPTLTK